MRNYAWPFFYLISENPVLRARILYYIYPRNVPDILIDVRRTGDLLQIIFVGEGIVPGRSMAPVAGGLRRFPDNIVGAGISGMFNARSVTHLTTYLLQFRRQREDI